MRLPKGWKVIKTEPDETGLKVTIRIPSDPEIRWSDAAVFTYPAHGFYFNAFMSNSYAALVQVGDCTLLIALPPGARVQGKEHWTPAVIRKAYQMILDDQMVGRIEADDALDRWENEGGAPREARPLLPYTEEEIDQSDTHSWLYGTHDVRCTFCHVKKGGPDSLKPCRWAS